jgi:glycine/D-amino acid oxidase-like deaminating enzyme
MAVAMHRRTLLQLFASLAVSGRAGAQPATGGRDKIVIAGGGIIGANLAYQLARRGAAVTVIEKQRPATGATAASFAWINATYSKRPWAYYNLNRLGMEAWRQLDRDFAGGLPVTWGGSVEWYQQAAQAAEFRGDVRQHQAWGYPTEIIDVARLRELERHLAFSDVAVAGHATAEGHVDPVRATEVLLARAATLGARVEHPCELTGLDQAQDRLRAVRTTKGDIEANVLIVACGTDTPKVAAMAGVTVPLKPSPGVLVHTAPQPRLIDRVVLAPIAHMKQKPDGRIVTGVGFGGTPSKDDSREGGVKFLKTASAVLPELGDAQLEKVTLGWRPLPKDDFPIIGFAPGRRDVYITVMHSGVTLSPLVGRLAAVEILDGVSAEPLEPYRSSRFA